MNVRLRPEKYLRYLYLPNLFTTKRTKEILSVNPTVEPHREEAKEVHVHIFDFDEDIYHKTIRITLIKWLRPEQKFNGLDELKVQLAKDEALARKCD